MVDVVMNVDWWSKVLQLPWIPYYTQVPVSKDDLVASSSSSNIDSNTFILYWALALTIGFTLFVYIVEGYLDYRQLQSYQSTKFPDALTQTVSAIDNDMKHTSTKVNQDESKSSSPDDADTVEKTKLLLPQLQDKFRKAQAYGLDKIQFGMIASLYDVFESIAFLFYGFAPFIWDYSVQKGNEWFALQEEKNEILISLLFLSFITVIGTITSLPFELYSTFQIERKHGFNKQTLTLFITDKIKGLLLSAIIGTPFAYLLLYIIKTGGKYFYIYVWFFLFIFSIIMMTLVPVVIMPLFNKYEPLPEGTLKTRIYALADQLKYPLTKLFVMDGSKRSSHSNAFMFGFGKNKRIVLFDTLLTQVKEDEILAILGHELGHWKLGHTLSNFVTTQVYTAAAFYFFALTYGSTDLYAAFGFNDPKRPTATLIALMLFFQTLWAPVDKVLSFILTIVSRQNEFGADKFSVQLGMSRDLQSGLCKIHLENLGAMNPDPYYSAYHYSHPPLVERLRAMMALDEKRK
jgi:STE24 endopeptidase